MTYQTTNDFDLTRQDGTYTGATGELVVSDGGTITLPTPTAGEKFGVRALRNNVTLRSNGSIEASTNDRRIDSEGNVVFVSDGTEWYLVSGDEYFGFGIPDISNYSFTQSADGPDTNLNGMVIGDAGSKIYSADGNNRKIYTQTLTTDYDISTIDNTSSISTYPRSKTPQALEFNNDGTKRFETQNGTVGNKISEHTLSTPYDMSTATLESELTAQGDPRGVTFNDNGKKMYEVDGNGKIHEYDLNTAFDISTSTVVQNITSQDGTPTGLQFHSSGERMWEVGKSGQKIYELDLSTPFDISTASLNNSISTQDSDPEEIEFSPDFSRLFELGDNADKFYQYDL